MFTRNLKATFASYIMEAYFLLVVLTSRIVFECNPESRKILEGGSETGYLLSIWHGKIFFSTRLLSEVPKMVPSKMKAVTSTHQDGLYVEKFLERFKIKSIRGSSNKGGFQAMVRIIDSIKKGYSIVITPDGPKGPRHECNGNIHNLAIKYNIPVVPLCFASSRVKIFKTWDQFFFPLPFSKIYLDVDAPLCIKKDEKPKEFRLRIINAMIEQEKNVERKAGVNSL